MTITAEDIVRAKTDSKFREKFVIDNSQLVWFYVNQKIKVAEQKPDAFQEGMFGFLESINSFDVSVENCIPHTWLCRRIEHRISKFLLSKIKNGVTVDWRILFYVNRSNGKKTEFLTKDGNWVTSTNQKMSDFVKIAKGEHRNIANEFLSTETVEGRNTCDETVGSFLFYKDERNQLEVCSDKEFIWKLRDFFKVTELSNEHKMCVVKRLGLKDGVPKSVRKVAEEINLSRTTVSNFYKELINEFRKYLKEQEVASGI